MVLGREPVAQHGDLLGRCRRGWAPPPTSGAGVWQASQLYLSIGGPAIRRALAIDPRVIVHLESGTDVVIVEGRAEGPCDDDRVIAAYDRKYAWSYDIAEHGPLTANSPSTVLAW
jgi:hypothetical protein